MQNVVYWIRSKDHTDIRNEGYVGVTNDFDKRMKRHSSLKSGSHILANAIKKHGWKNLVKSIVVVGDESYCYEIENSLRGGNEIGWNIVAGGGQPPVHTNETKQRGGKWNESLFSNKSNPMYDEKVVKARSGEFHHAKDPEYRKRFSARQVGENNPIYDSEVRLFQHKNGESFTGTSYEFRTVYNLPKAEVSKVVMRKPKYNSVKGWKYIGIAA